MTGASWTEGAEMVFRWWMETLGVPEWVSTILIKKGDKADLFYHDLFVERLL